MSFKYFENRDCEYYPCHKAEHLNCLFCFCPLYHLKDCGHNPKFKDVNGEKIKDCSDCIFPHLKENYDKVIETIKEL